MFRCSERTCGARHGQGLIRRRNAPASQAGEAAGRAGISEDRGKARRGATPARSAVYRPERPFSQVCTAFSAVALKSGRSAVRAST